MVRVVLALWRLIVPAVLCLPTGAVAADAVTPPSPTLSLYLERQSLQANDAIGGAVRISNGGQTPLSDISIQLDGPSFISLQQAMCAGPHAPPPTALAAFSTLLVPICLETQAEVIEGDFNVQIVGSFSWQQADGVIGTGFAAAPSTIQVGLFGTASVAGVSLRLAAFVLPGLLLFIVLRLGGFPGVAALGGAEVTTLSVVTSVSLTMAADTILPAGIAAGISPVRFLLLCLSGFGIGAILMLLDTVRRRISVGLANRNLIESTDGTLDAMAKILRAQRGVFSGPVTVEDAERQQFVGALSGPTKDGGKVVVGWFQVDASADPALKRRLAMLETRRDYAGMVRAARNARDRIKLEIRNAVRRVEDGRLVSTGEGLVRVGQAEIAPNDVERTRPLGNAPPITTA